MATLDGLEILRKEFSHVEAARLLERTAQWVSPETFKLLPLWYPESARREPLYKSGWTEPQYKRNQVTKEKVQKRESNILAAKALNATQFA